MAAICAIQGINFRISVALFTRIKVSSQWCFAIFTYIYFLHLENCSNPPCGVTNMRIELTSEIPDQGPKELNSLMKWEPSSDINGGNYIEFMSIYLR